MNKRIEFQIREYLWLTHGHMGLYGDDGEMQCSECGLDYKRDDLQIVVEKANKIRELVSLRKIRKDKWEKEFEDELYYTYDYNRFLALKSGKMPEILERYLDLIFPEWNNDIQEKGKPTKVKIKCKNDCIQIERIGQ